MIKIKEISSVAQSINFCITTLPPASPIPFLPFFSHCCCSVTQSCLDLCDPMDCSTPGFPSFTISQSFLKLMSIESVMPANHLASVVPFSCLQSFPASGFFQQVTSSSQLAKIRSFIFSISPPNELIFFRIDWNIQGWFPLGLTGLITLLPKGLSKVFSSTTVWKHQFFSASLNFRSYFWGKKSNSEFNWITSTSDGGERQI